MDWFKRIFPQTNTNDEEDDDSEQKDKKSKKKIKKKQSTEKKRLLEFDPESLEKPHERSKDSGRILSLFNPLSIRNRTDSSNELTKVVVDGSREGRTNDEEQSDFHAYRNLVDRAATVCASSDSAPNILSCFANYGTHNAIVQGMETKLEDYYNLMIRFGFITDYSAADPLVRTELLHLSFVISADQSRGPIRQLKFNIKDATTDEGKSMENVDLWIISLRIQNMTHTFEPEMQIKVTQSSENSSWLVMNDVDPLVPDIVADIYGETDKNGPEDGKDPSSKEGSVKKGEKEEYVEMRNIDPDDNSKNRRKVVANTVQDLFVRDVMPHDGARRDYFLENGYIGDLNRNPLWALFIVGKQIDRFRDYASVIRNDGGREPKDELVLVDRNLETFIVLESIRESPHIATPDPNFKYKIGDVVKNHGSKHFKMERTTWNSVLSIVEANIRTYLFSDLNFVLARFDEKDVILEKDEEFQMDVWLKARIFPKDLGSFSPSSSNTDSMNAGFVPKSD